MSKTNTATNDVAQKNNSKKVDAVMTVVSNSGELKQEPKKEEKAETLPAAVVNVLTVAELLKRNEQMNQLAKKRVALVDIHDKICAFSTSETAPGKLIFEDMHDN